MEPRDIAQRNKQKDRRQRGHDFQEEIRRSWRLVPHTWQYTITDGGGGSRPADKLVLCEDVNILQELKRTEGLQFDLSFLRPNQIQGLVDFDEVINRSYGLVGVSFHNVNRGLDECYYFRLITALRFMHRRDKLHIKLDEFRRQAIKCVKVERIEAEEPTYDLKGVAACCKSL